MNWLGRFVAANILYLALLVPSLSYATLLREYQESRSDVTRQRQLFDKAYETALADTLAALKSTHFKDGKEKTPQRVERDRVRAQGIEDLAAHPTASKSSEALSKMIEEYAAAQPDTQLEAVITSFLLREADKTPYERYSDAYNEFMAKMDRWSDAANEAQVELNIERMSLNDRRRQLDNPDGSKEITKAAIEDVIKNFRINSVIKRYIVSILAPTDSTGRPKTQDSFGSDQRKATIVLDLGKDFDTDEVARRIYTTMKTDSTVDPQEVFTRYISDELEKREAALSAK